MKLLIAGVIGVVVWQTICLIVDIATNEKEDAVIGTACGIWTCIFFAINAIRRLFVVHRYAALMVDPDGHDCWCKSNGEPEWLREIGYHFCDEHEKYKPEQGWRRNDCYFNQVNFRYTPKKIIRQRKAYRVSRKILQQAKAEYDKDSED